MTISEPVLMPRGLDRQHLSRLAHNSFTAAFIDEPRRADYLSQLDEYVRTNLTN